MEEAKSFPGGTNTHCSPLSYGPEHKPPWLVRKDLCRLVGIHRNRLGLVLTTE